MKSIFGQRTSLAFFGILVSFAAATVNAAVTIPDKPLLVADGVAPNILFILDDSGSMQFTAMPEDKYDGQWATYWDGSCVFEGYNSLPDEPRYRSSERNTIYYNPAKTYEGWKKADGTRYASTPYNNVYTSPVALTSDNGHVDWQGSNCVRNNGIPEDLTTTTQTYYVLKTGRTPGSTTDSDYDKYTIRPNGGGVYRGSGNGDTLATPTGRSQADEIQNFANWYSFHRTRMKVAKAGASEAFAEVIGSNLRVGFDSIWNRSQGSLSIGSTSGSAPSLAVPGKFNATNAPTFFSYLQSAQAMGGTPLRGALQRAGRYYQTTAPYRETSDGQPLSCRANYSILTTDGFWNDDSGFSPDSKPGGGAIADEDGDSYSRTLADVAYAYYANDLMSDTSGQTPLANNVEPTSRDPKVAQHMVTFGVSIGLSGTKTVPSDESQWPAGNDATFWPDPINNDGKQRIDDLWHAAVNTTGKFIVASDSKSFADGLKSALSEIQDRKLSGGGITTNSSRLDEDRRTFQATFNPANWLGDVVAVNSSDAGGDDEAWRYSSQVAAAGTAYSGGTVLTHDGTQARLFSNSGGLTITGLAKTVGGTNYSADQILAYLKGDAQNEVRNSGKLRNRTVAIGDVVNSSPYFDRETDTLYVGSNDGFMHAMVGSTGVPRFRYLPRAVKYSRLSELADPSYGKDVSHPHRYFMDGQIYVSPKLISTNLDRNFLLGAMGRGGKGVFLLDVTSPSAMDTTTVKWDKTFQDGDTGADADMGYVLGQTAILKDQRDRTIAVVPNGVNSTNGKAVVFIYVLGADGSTSTPIKLTTPNANNAMMSIGAADANSDGLVDTLYAGDILGNLWKWTIDAGTSGNGNGNGNGGGNNNNAEWTAALGTTATPIPMFTARNASNQVQAITSGIAVARAQGGSQLNVIFGTGRYIESEDVDNVDVQTIYSLVDNPSNTTAISGRGALTPRTFTGVGADSSGRFSRALKDYAVITSGTRGWYLDLGTGDQAHSAAGERVIARPQIRGEMLVVGTMIPKASTDPCDAGRTTGFQIRVNAFTGTNPAVGSYFGSTGGATERLGGATSGTDNAIGSVQSEIGGIGGVRITEKDVITGGMDGEIGRSNWNNTNSNAPRRIMWREIVEGM